jgi:single-stranded-DNA-specific exonuclease
MKTDYQIRIRQPGVSEDLLPAELHPVIRRVLLARGIGAPETLELELKRLLPPGQLKGLGRAAGLLSSAIREDQRILVVVRTGLNSVTA